MQETVSLTACEYSPCYLTTANDSTPDTSGYHHCELAFKHQLVTWLVLLLGFWTFGAAILVFVWCRRRLLVKTKTV